MSYISANDTLMRLQNETAQRRYAAGQENLGSAEMDRDAFMQLLLAQLQHQDPMNPMEDAEFISQQAQFTQIDKTNEMIEAINGSNMITQATSLVGKDVEFVLEDGSTTMGTVDSVKFGANDIGIVVGEQTYAMGQVVQIFAPGTLNAGSGTGTEGE